MSVDKFGRNGDRATPVYTGINIANLTNNGGNTSIGAIDRNSNIIKNVALLNQDVVTKNYIYTHTRFFCCWWCCVRRCSINDWF